MDDRGVLLKNESVETRDIVDHYVGLRMICRGYCIKIVMNEIRGGGKTTDQISGTRERLFLVEGGVNGSKTPEYTEYGAEEILYYRGLEEESKKVGCIIGH